MKPTLILLTKVFLWILKQGLSLDFKDIKLQPNSTLTFDIDTQIKYTSFTFSNNSQIVIEGGIRFNDKHGYYTSCEFVNTGLFNSLNDPAISYIYAEQNSSVIFSDATFTTNTFEDTRCFIVLNKVVVSSFLRCDFSNNIEGIRYFGSTGGNYINGCTFNDVTSGVTAWDSDITFGNFRGSLNSFSSSEKIGGAIEGYSSQLDISRTYISGFQVGVSSRFAGSNLTVQGLGSEVPMIENCKYGVFINNQDYFLMFSANVSACDEYGIKMDNTPFCRIVECQFENNHYGNIQSTDSRIFSYLNNFHNTRDGYNGGFLRMTRCNLYGVENQSNFVLAENVNLRFSENALNYCRLDANNLSYGIINRSIFRNGPFKEGFGQLNVRSESVGICFNEFYGHPTRGCNILFRKNNCFDTRTFKNKFNEGNAGIIIEDQIGEQDRKGNEWFVNNPGYVGLSTDGNALLSRFKVNPSNNNYITNADPTTIFEITNDSGLTGCYNVILPLTSGDDEELSNSDEQLLLEQDNYCDSINVWIKSQLFANTIISNNHILTNNDVESWAETIYFTNALQIQQIRSLLGDLNIDHDYIDSYSESLISNLDNARDNIVDDYDEFSRARQEIRSLANNLDSLTTDNIEKVDSIANQFEPLCQFDSTFISVIKLYTESTTRDKEGQLPDISTELSNLINVAQDCYSNVGHSKYYAQAILKKHNVQFNNSCDNKDNINRSVLNDQEQILSNITNAIIYNRIGMQIGHVHSVTEYLNFKKNLSTGLYFIIKEYDNNTFNTEKVFIH